MAGTTEEVTVTGVFPWDNVTVYNDGEISVQCDNKNRICTYTILQTGETKTATQPQINEFVRLFNGVDMPDIITRIRNSGVVRLEVADGAFERIFAPQMPAYCNQPTAQSMCT